MVQYWQVGEVPWPDIEEVVDQNVGEALKEYIEDGVFTIVWDEEPSIVFSVGPDLEFTKKEGLFEILVWEVGMFRPGGNDEEDLFFDPEGDRRAILMQELLRTYLKWKEGGVHVPSKEESE
jgi:hypothetical protein